MEYEISNYIENVGKCKKLDFFDQINLLLLLHFNN